MRDPWLMFDFWPTVKNFKGYKNIKCIKSNKRLNSWMTLDLFTSHCSWSFFLFFSFGQDESHRKTINLQHQEGVCLGKLLENKQLWFIHHITLLVQCFQVFCFPHSPIAEKSFRSRYVNMMFSGETRFSFPSSWTGHFKAEAVKACVVYSLWLLPSWEESNNPGQSLASQRPFFPCFSVYIGIIFSIICLSDARWTEDGKSVEHQLNNPEEIVNRPRWRSAKKHLS